MKLFDNSAVPTLKLASVKKAKIGKRLPRKVKKGKMDEANGTSEASTPTGADAGTSTHAKSGATGGTTQTPIRVPRELARFLYLRETMQKKNTARKGYDKKFALFALNLHLSCPSAYCVLRKSLRLPPPALLSRVNIGVGTRINTDLIKCFESKMEKVDHREKECVLCIDEVELTKKLFYAIDKDEIVGLEEIGGVLRLAPASRALVLVARGLRGGWTQPLGYFYLSDDTDMCELVAPLRKLIEQILYGRINCRVRAILSALGPTFAELAQALQVTVENPFVLDATSRRQIYFLHDPEQLVLTLRDTLMAYDIKFRDVASGGVLRASWRDVELLYRTDVARALRLLPELTRARVHPTPRESLQVQHAAALFTRRVAAHMSACTALDSKSVGTVRLLRMLADLRTVLTAPRPRDLQRITVAIDEVSTSLCDMRIVSADGEEHDADTFVRSLQMSLAGAVHLLSERARGERDAPLRLERFGLRPVRRFIERVEGPRGRVAPQAFRDRFRRWTMRHLLAPIASAKPTRADDLAGLLWKVEDESLAELDGGAKKSIAVGELEHRIDLTKRCSVKYVSGLLLRECRRAHGCAVFVEWAKDIDRFQKIIRNMDSVFKKMFEDKQLNAVGNRALLALSGCIATRLPCACFPRDTFCRLFVRFRIRAALQTYNRSLRGVAKPGSSQWLFQ